jgi:hypothetical protein
MSKKSLPLISNQSLIVSIALILCLLSGCTYMQDPTPNTKQLEGRVEAIHRLQGVPVLHIDANHDYRITQDEFVAYAKRTYEVALKKFDRDKDGLISEAEYIYFKKDKTAILLKLAMDTNDDKQISEAEFDTFHKAKLAAMTGPAPGGPMFSLADVVVQAKKRFAQLDANQDGMLDATELPKTIEKPYYSNKGNYPKNKTRTSDGWSHSGGWYYTGCEHGGTAPKPCWPVFYPTPGCSPWFGCFQGDGPDPSGPDEPSDPCVDDPFGCDCVFSSSWPCQEW